MPELGKETSDQQTKIPWWIKSAPLEVVVPKKPGDRIPGGRHHLYSAIISLTEPGNSEPTPLFVKAFDTQGAKNTDNPTLVMEHRRLSGDVPHQREILRKYSEKYPETPNPVLWSANSRDQDGNRIIIQELAPETTFIQTISNVALSTEDRRGIYFQALIAYCRYAIVATAHCQSWAERTEEYYYFGDQKSGDLRWDAKKERLVVLDVQSCRAPYGSSSRSLDFVTRPYAGLAVFRGGDYEKVVRAILTPEESELLNKINESKLPGIDINQLFLDFAEHKLADNDNRLQ